MPARFTSRQLDAFIAASELANFTLAARRLHLSSSAVSSLIVELEGTLGFSLFDRTTRRVALSPEGRRFLPAALAVQRQLGRAAAAAIDIREHKTEVIRVAAPQMIAAILLPRLIAAQRALRPSLRVRVIDTGVEWLADRVATGEADLALGPDRGVPPGVARTSLFATPWVLWCRPEHPLAARAELEWADLEGEELFAAGRDHEQGALHGASDAARVPTLDRVEVVDNITTSFGLTAANLGVTFSPEYVAPLARAFGLVGRRLCNPHVEREVSLYHATERRVAASIELFRAVIVAQAEAMARQEA